MYARRFQVPPRPGDEAHNPVCVGQSPGISDPLGDLSARTGVLQGLLVICFLLTSNRWQSPETELRTDGGSSAARATTISTLKLPIVWLGMILFFTCAGTETSVGQWSYSLLTKARSIVPRAAGLWVSAFWVSHTAGRIIFGLVVDHVGAVRIVSEGE